MDEFYIKGLKLGNAILKRLDDEVPIVTPEDAAARLIALLAAACASDATFRSPSLLPSAALERLKETLTIVFDDVQKSKIKRDQ